MERVSKKEIYARIGKLQELLCRKGIGAVLIVQRADLVYFSGTGQNAHLIVPQVGEPTLLVRKSFQRAQGESPLAEILPMRSFKDIGRYLGQAQSVGMELDVLPVNFYLRYQGMMPDAQICDVSDLIKQVRLIKSEFEISQQRLAGAILDKVWRKLPDILEPGMSEVALAGKLEAEARALGSQGVVRMRTFNQEMGFAHIFSGPNAAYPSFFDGPTGGVGLGVAFPHGPGLDQIVPNTPLVVDIAVAYNGYTVDQTRIASLGPLDLFFKENYAKALQIQDILLQKAKPGVVAGDLYEMTLSAVSEMGLKDNYMGFVPDQVSFVAHGVGLELDELPVLAKGSTTVLEAGMVFAAEPKFVFPGQGTVGIENTFVVTEHGLERITIAGEGIVEV